MLSTSSFTGRQARAMRAAAPRRNATVRSKAGLRFGGNRALTTPANPRVSINWRNVFEEMAFGGQVGPTSNVMDSDSGGQWYRRIPAHFFAERMRSAIDTNNNEELQRSLVYLTLRTAREVDQVRLGMEGLQTYLANNRDLAIDQSLSLLFTQTAAWVGHPEIALDTLESDWFRGEVPEVGLANSQLLLASTAFRDVLLPKMVAQVREPQFMTTTERRRPNGTLSRAGLLAPVDPVTFEIGESVRTPVRTVTVEEMEALSNRIQKVLEERASQFNIPEPFEMTNRNRISFLASIGKVDEALELLSEVKVSERGWADLRLLNALAMALVLENRIDEAWQHVEHDFDKWPERLQARMAVALAKGDTEMVESIMLSPAFNVHVLRADVQIPERRQILIETFEKVAMSLAPAVRSAARRYLQWAAFDAGIEAPTWVEVPRRDRRFNNNPRINRNRQPEDEGQEYATDGAAVEETTDASSTEAGSSTSQQ